jgi:NhaA family Na+:H+ antiporter
MNKQEHRKVGKNLPVRQVRDLYFIFREFLQLEVTGGIVLLIATVFALLWANSPWADRYYAIWEMPFSIGVGDWVLSHDLHWWINDAFMVLFFLLVGLEIKRETLVGELASFRQAVLPIAAAVGGMIVPALIYVMINLNSPGISGWGIPMATDIAFALGVMTLVGQRLPIGLKVFLTALAIVDDIGAIFVIALFYSGRISWGYLAAAAGVLAILLLINRMGVRNLFIYSFLGLGVWFLIMNSGIHATIAGVLVALFIPARRKLPSETFVERVGSVISRFQQTDEGDPRILTAEQRKVVHQLESTGQETQIPLQRLEHGLHPWVTYGVIPLFALANAGVSFSQESLSVLISPISLGIVAGLVIGKQVGISLATWLTVKLNLAALPDGVNGRQIYATGWLAGIGFTMSLFISELAFTGKGEVNAAKIGILAASLISGAIGYILIRSSVGGRGKVS